MDDGLRSRGAITVEMMLFPRAVRRCDGIHYTYTEREEEEEKCLLLCRREVLMDLMEQ